MAMENGIGHRIRMPSYRTPSFHIPSSVAPELEAAALHHSSNPTLLLDRLKIICVANRAVQKLFGATDTLIGQSFCDLKIDFANKAGFSRLDCDSVLASLEDQWLGRRESVNLPRLKVPESSFPSNRNGENTIVEAAEISYVGKTHSPPQEHLEEEADSQEMHVDVSIRHILTPPDQSRVPTKARMTASTFAIRGQPYYLVAFQTIGGALRPTLVAPNQTPARPASDRLLQTTSHGSVNETTVDLCLSSVEQHWPDIVEKMRYSVFDATRSKVLLLSADERYCMPNKTFLRTLGYAADHGFACDGMELISKIDAWDETFSERLTVTDFPPVDLVRSRKDFRGRRVGFIHKTTGEKKVFNVSGECIYDVRTGIFVGGITRFQELEELTKLLRYHKSWIGDHETTCNIMPHLIWTMMPCGSLDYFSERWYEYTGLTPEQSIGLGYQQAIHPCDLWKVQGNRPALMESGDYEMEIRHRRFDGKYRWFLTRSKPLRDGSGKIIKYYGTNTDIHDLVTARERERRAKEQLKTGLAHSEIHVFGVNKEGIVNLSEGDDSCFAQGEEPGCKRLLLGRNVFDLVNEIPPKVTDSSFGESMRMILSESNTAIAVSEDNINGRSFRTRFIPDYDPRGWSGTEKPGICGLIGVSIDISDLKARVALEMEKEKLQVLEQAANASNRLKSQFLANMSHEIRTPLAGISGLTSLLTDTPLDAEQTEHLEGIKLSANILLTIVNDVLDFSKIESGRLNIETIRFRPHDTVNELSRLLRCSASSKPFTFECRNELPPDLDLLGDPGRIRQVLSNLLTNSFKFTQSGYVRITALLMQVDEAGAPIQFVIEDTGIGMDEHVLKNLFKPFRQGDVSTARLYGGTGLGLTICKQLLNLMHGQIEIESTVSVGSKAIVTIPMQVARKFGSGALPTPPHEKTDPLNQAADSLPEDLSLSPVERVDISILLVEDNAINRRIAIKTIRKLGFSNVTAANDGRQALDYLSNRKNTIPRPPAPTVILMDVQMPVMDGYEATYRLRHDEPFTSDEDLRDVPVVALTASAIQGDREKCFDKGMSDYLSKPFSTEDLDRMILKWAARRRERGMNKTKT